MHRRLALVDIERRGGDQPPLQGPRQRLFVDDGPRDVLTRIADRFIRASARRSIR